MAKIQCTYTNAHRAQRSGGRGENAIIYIEGWVLEKEPIEVGWWWRGEHVGVDHQGAKQPIKITVGEERWAVGAKKGH